jgi:DNA-binding IclR family transcriptional regulator
VNKDLGLYEERALRILARNHVRVADIARFTGTGKAGARRIIDTLSLKHPVYEAGRGLYGMAPKDG